MNLKEACVVVEFVEIHKALYDFKIEISLYIRSDYVILRLDCENERYHNFETFGDREQKNLSLTEIQGLILEFLKEIFVPRCEKCGQILKFDK